MSPNSDDSFEDVLRHQAQRGRDLVREADTNRRNNRDGIRLTDEQRLVILDLANWSEHAAERLAQIKPTVDPAISGANVVVQQYTTLRRVEGPPTLPADIEDTVRALTFKVGDEIRVDETDYKVVGNEIRKYRFA